MVEGLDMCLMALTGDGSCGFLSDDCGMCFASLLTHDRLMDQFLTVLF